MSGSAQIHLTDSPPPFCSGCHMPGQSPPGRRHVDFGAAYSGPVFAAGEDRAVRGGTPISVDDLILCEDCVAAAAGEIGLGDVTEAKRELAEEREANERKSDRLAAQAAYIDQLKAAFAAGEDLEKAMTLPAAPPGADQQPDVDLEKASMRELEDLGKPLGLTFRPGTSKVKARELIREAQAKAAA